MLRMAAPVLRRRACRIQPPVASPLLGATAASSSSARPPWQRRAWARARLTAGEWQERCAEWRERGAAWLQDRRTRDDDRSSAPISHRIEDFIARARIRWREENDRFDDWFNAKWPIWQAELLRRCRELRKSLREGRRQPLSEPRSITKPFDVPSMILVGSGVGIVAQGVPTLGVLLALSGVVRGVRNFVIQKVDAEDMQGLFRWAPASLGEARRVEIFNRLRHEIHAARKAQEGDPQYTRRYYPGSQAHQAMDPLNDYTPEKLFVDAMASVARHQRVLETLGGEVKVVAEPDKVVYRIVEGVAEVYLAWRIAGQAAGAEIQVKATACLVDYIYVFPEPVGRYQVAPPSFVIRPQGSWSGNTEDLPRYQKSPFGKQGDSGRLYHNRSGVFEMDWSIREFRHGKEDRQGWRS